MAKVSRKQLDQHQRHRRQRSEQATIVWTQCRAPDSQTKSIQTANDRRISLYFAETSRDNGLVLSLFNGDMTTPPLVPTHTSHRSLFHWRVIASRAPRDQFCQLM